MKTSRVILSLLVIVSLIQCGKKSDGGHDAHQHDTVVTEASPNQVLYDQVMAVHDEVMPKMDEIFKLKESLKNKIADDPALPEPKKKEIENTIVKLDSAAEGMMVWMRKFSPVPDSLGEEKAREYLEDEMVKVQKVKTDILESIEKAKAL